MKQILQSLLVVGGFLAWVALAPNAHATILTFNIDNVSPPGSPATSGGSLTTTHAAYGDNVSSLTQTVGSFVYNYGAGNGFTPNIAVAYSVAGAGGNTTYYTDGDAAVSPSWKDVNFLNGGTGALFRYTFTPNVLDQSVLVNSFDVFGYASDLSHTVSWTVRRDSPTGAILASGGPNVLTTQTHAFPFTVITGAPAYFGTVVLEVNHVLGSGGSFGLDNINFQQVGVPEPGTMTLLGVGAVGLATATRRRRQRFLTNS